MTKTYIGSGPRSMSKVDVKGPDDCWEWAGGLQKQGYGNFHVSSPNGQPWVSWLAHRFAWTLAYGPIPEDLGVLHSCDNRPCCNPTCLFLGTDADNMRDMVLKGRSATCGYYVRGERHARAKVSDADVERVLALRGKVRAAELARELGVGVHLIWHYWRNGGRSAVQKQVRRRKTGQLLPPRNILSLPRS